MPDDRPSVAVLPFGNLSSDEEDAYLSGGIHEEVISQLAKIGGLKVVSRTSVMGYRDTNQNVRQIAAELGVGTILEGTVQKVLDRVRVTALLVDAVTDEDLWSGSFDREITLENLLDIQAEVARQIAGALETELTVEEEALVGAKLTLTTSPPIRRISGGGTSSISPTTRGRCGQGFSGVSTGRGAGSDLRPGLDGAG